MTPTDNYGTPPNKSVLDNPYATTQIANGLRALADRIETGNLHSHKAQFHFDELPIEHTRPTETREHLVTVTID